MREVTAQGRNPAGKTLHVIQYWDSTCEQSSVGSLINMTRLVSFYFYQYNHTDVILIEIRKQIISNFQIFLHFQATEILILGSMHCRVLFLNSIFTEKFSNFFKKFIYFMKSVKINFINECFEITMAGCGCVRL